MKRSSHAAVESQWQTPCGQVPDFSHECSCSSHSAWHPHPAIELLHSSLRSPLGKALKLLPNHAGNSEEQSKPSMGACSPRNREPFFGVLNGFSFWVRNLRRREPAAAGISGSSDRFPRVGTAGTLSLSPNESRAHGCNRGRAPPHAVGVMIFRSQSDGHSDLGASAAAGGAAGGLGFPKRASSMGTLTSILSAVIRYD